MRKSSRRNYRTEGLSNMEETKEGAEFWWRNSSKTATLDTQQATIGKGDELSDSF
jgi:hypothetical protein